MRSMVLSFVVELVFAGLTLKSNSQKQFNNYVAKRLLVEKEPVAHTHTHTLDTITNIWKNAT